MIVTREDELLKLRRRVTELEGEVAEWRRQAGDRQQFIAGLDRVAKVRHALTLGAPPARILNALLDRSPKIVSKLALFDATGSDPDKVDVKVIDVHVCKLRSALGRAQLADTIETIWGTGYAINAAHAARIRAWLAK